METIFALSSGLGQAGVAVVRLSGERAGPALARLTGRKTLPTPRLATYVTFRQPDTQETLDHGLALWFPAPASFTGEDVVELHIHGSRAVARQLLHVLGQEPGLRLAEPGEFARRAFQNGKMDLTQAEGIADLIAAETEAQHQQAIRQMDGALKIQCDAWRKMLIGLLAQIEAYIDFPDEDLPAPLLQTCVNEAATLLDTLTQHVADHRGKRIREGITIALLGAPNAGKSSLLNHLARRDAAIVSETPGTTRDVLEVPLNIGGYAVTLIDTAGLRESTDAIESEGIRRAKARAEAAEITLLLFDAAALPALDTTTLSLLDDRAIVLFTKADLIEAPSTPPLTDHTPLVISAQTGEGIAALLARIEEKLGLLMTGKREDPLVTNERQRYAITHAIHSLEQFLTSQELNHPVELMAEHLRHAASQLGHVTGVIGLEDILDAVFSRFCIGK
ncbi:MAG: tRNA uridine-5-carboxymethylaminomethyl(34) synthesis GTPase MnmE [Hyphomicrobiales bacterium]|nr:tRNA uridine-5-carboxymethylaminomethyl(34) synthesis GTPase MnmE [Hyphomicrobiales bacterium]